MTSAAAFEQAILAVPNSTMATNYAAAVTKANAAPDTATTDQIMTAFFESTSGYKSVTADQVTAIAIYYNQFPLVWAEASTGVTYYLYSSTGTAKISSRPMKTIAMPGRNSRVASPRFGAKCGTTHCRRSPLPRKAN